MLNLCHIFCLKRRKIWAFVLILCLICGLTPTAESVSVKLRGKIALGGILSGLAYVTYVLVKRDKRAAEKFQLHLGPPDRVIQFERGFDRWRINYHGEQCYLFRNNLLIKTAPCANLIFKLTLWSNDVRSLNPPVPVLQEIPILGKRKPVARNEVEGGYTGRYFIHQTVLTEPQGKLKIPILGKHKPIARNEVEGGYTGRYFIHQTVLTEPQGKLKIDTPVSGRPRWLRLCLLHPQRAPQFVSSYLYRSEAERSLGPQLWLSH